MNRDDRSRDALRVEVRPAQAQDADQIARVHVRAVRNGYRGLVLDEVLDALDEVKRSDEWQTAIEKLRQDRCLYVAVAEQQVVGFAGGGPARKHDESGLGELYVLNVEPNAWRQRVGSTLERAVEQWLGERFEAAVLWVLDGNARARRLYESRGWSADGTRMDDELYSAPAVRYRKQLSRTATGRFR